MAQIACQIALAHPKCKVIALASSSKIKQLEKLGCHAVLDYTKEGFKKELRKEGLIDVYFDNGMFFLLFLQFRSMGRLTNSRRGDS